jgi:hypothetical protein
MDSTTESKSGVLVHGYDLVVGGRIAFIYDRLPGSDQWQVVGVAYDALKSTYREKMAAFFPNGAPTNSRLFHCHEDSDWYHTPAGSDAVASMYAAWQAGNGRILYAKYAAGALATAYDPVKGRNVAVMPTNFTNNDMVQFGLFESLDKVIDLHFAEDDDFSIVTAYRDCVKG